MNYLSPCQERDLISPVHHLFGSVASSRKQCDPSMILCANLHLNPVMLTRTLMMMMMTMLMMMMMGMLMEMVMMLLLLLLVVVVVVVAAAVLRLLTVIIIRRIRIILM